MSSNDATLCLWLYAVVSWGGHMGAAAAKFAERKRVSF